MNKHTIYIPTKGRADTNGTLDILEKEGLNYFVVIEREEVEAYSKRTDKILVLPESNKGIAYSRSWIKNYSKSIGEEYHWQLDDDITSFCNREAKQRITSADEAISAVESEVLKHSNIGIAGLNFNAWKPGKKPIIYNRPVYRCVIISNKSEHTWRRFVPFEDWDYSMQLLKAGYATMMFDFVRINSPKPGTLNGGLKDFYENNVRTEVRKELLVEWPDCILRQTNSAEWIDARHFFKKHNNKLSIGVDEAPVVKKQTELFE